MKKTSKNKSERKSQVSAVASVFAIAFILLYAFVAHASSLDIFKVSIENKTNTAGEPVIIEVTGPNSTNYTLNIYTNQSLVLSESAITTPAGRYLHRPNFTIPGRYTANLSENNFTPTIASAWFDIILQNLSGSVDNSTNPPITESPAYNISQNETHTIESTSSVSVSSTASVNKVLGEITAIDSKSKNLGFTIDIIDRAGKKIIKHSDRRGAAKAASQNAFISALNPPSSASPAYISAGIYDADLTFDSGPVKTLHIEEWNITSDAATLGIDEHDDPASFGGNFGRVYSIDPSGLDFRQATATVTATGQALYKCRDWNFASQLCAGAWQKIQNIIPGENYTLTLDSSDPGYAEINITSALHLAQDYSFISDIYEQVRAADSIYSEPIYSNEIVRAGFEKNMTNGNVINLYMRTGGTEPVWVEIYEKGTTTPLLAKSPVLAPMASVQENLILENMTGYADTFDIITRSTDPSAYLEYDYIHDAFDAYFNATLYIYDTKRTQDPTDDVLYTSSTLSNLKTNGTVWNLGNIGTIFNYSTYIIELKIRPNATYDLDADYRIETFFRATNPFALTEISGAKEYLINTSYADNDGPRQEDIYVSTRSSANYTNDTEIGETGVIWGDLDIVGSVQGVFDLSWWQNDDTPFAGGEWTITDIDTDTAADEPYGLSTGDVDNDGDIDVLLGTRSGGVYLYENDGTPLGPSWTMSTVDTGLDRVYAVELADLDNDGWLDLIMGDRSGVIYIYRNDGTPFSGAWAPFTMESAAGGEVHDLAVGDIDHNSYIDIVAAVFDAQDITWYNNDGTPFAGGEWTAVDVDTATGSNRAETVAVGDFDNNGWLDVVAGTDDNFDSPDIYLYQNDQTPSGPDWTTATVDSATAGIVYGLAVGDIDNDGYLDIVSTAVAARDVHWHINDRTPFNGGWTTVDIDTDTAGADVYGVAVGDVDGNGWLDVIAGTSGADIYLYENDGTPSGSGWTTTTVESAAGGTVWDLSFVDIEMDSNSNIIDYYYNSSESLEGGAEEFGGWNNLSANTNYSFYFIMRPGTDWSDSDTGNITFYLGNESSSGWARTEEKIFNADITPFRIKWTWTINVTDRDPPKWRNQGANDTYITPDESILLYAEGKDNNAISYGLLSTNESGAWQNKSGVYGSPLSMGNLQDAWVWSNFTWQNTSISTDTTVGWRIWYNDTSGNRNTTDIMTFTVMVPPKITIQFPLNQSYPTTTIWFNITLDEQGSWCGYSLDSSSNITMTNSSGNWNSLNSSMSEGAHYVRYSCNDTLGNMNSSQVTQYFTVDTTNPRYSLNSTNSTESGSSVKLSLYWTDNIALSGYIFSFDNGTGSFSNDTFTAMTGALNWSNTTKTINTTYAATIRWRVFANDTAGNMNASSIYTFTTTDTTPPKYSLNQTNSTEIGQNTRFSLYWQDYNLAGYIFSFDNGTGTFSNDTYTPMAGTGNWSNITKSLNTTVNTLIRWRIFANDTAGNMNASEIFSFTTVITYPQYSLNQTNNTNAGYSTLFSLYWQDNGLAGYIFSFDNCTGAFVNDTYSVMTGTGNWSNVTKTINSTVGCTIRWRVFANDTTGNMNSSAIYTLVTTDDTPPSWQNQGENATSIYPAGSIQLYAQGLDTESLQYAVLSTNETGAWQNKTQNYSSPMSMGSSKNTWTWSNFTWQNASVPVGANIGWRIWYNDSKGNWQPTDIMTFYIKNSTKSYFDATVYIYSTKNTLSTSDDTLYLTSTIRNLEANGTTWNFGNLGTIFNYSAYTAEVRITPDTNYSFDADSFGESFFFGSAPFALNGTASRKELILNSSYAIDDGPRTEDVFVSQTSGTDFSTDEGAGEAGFISGDVDIISASRNNNIYWHNNTNDGSSWSLNTIDSTGNRPHSVAVGDIDSDGDIDVVYGDENQDVVLMRNLNGIGTSWGATTIESGAGDIVYSVALGDIDSDGDLDVLYGTGTTTRNIYSRLNSNGLGTSWSARTTVYSPSGTVYQIALGDLDGDGDLDAVSANDNNDIYRHMNTNGLGTSWSTVSVSSTNRPHDVVLADIDRDRDLDIIFGDENQDVLLRLNANSLGTSWTSQNIDTTAGAVVYAVTAGDIDGDGDVDVAYGGYDSGTTSYRVYWANNANGLGTSWSTKNQVYVSATSDIYSLDIADIDSDGDADLVSGSRDTLVRFHKNNNSAGSSWVTSTVYDASDEIYDVAVADMNRDSNSNRLELYYNSSEGAETGVEEFGGWDNLTKDTGYSFYFIFSPDNDWQDNDKENMTLYLGNESGGLWTLPEAKVFGAARTPIKVRWEWTINVTDRDPPKWRNQGANDTYITPDESILLYAEGKDNNAISYALLSTNESGAWQNKSGVYSSPMFMNNTQDTWTWSNFTWQNTSISTDTTVGWRFWYNDTYGNWNTTDIMTFTVMVPPKITIQSPSNRSYSATTIWFNITLDEQGSWCGYSLDSRSNITMTNISGNWNSLNSSMSEGSHNVRYSCNDTLGNMNSSQVTQYFTVDTTYPKYSLNQTNSTTPGKDTLFSLYWTDNIALSGYIFSFDNGTGSFSNDTYVAMSGTSGWSNVTKAINSTPFTTIRWRVFANDTAGNMNTSSIYSFQAIDTAPPTYSNIKQTPAGNPELGADVQANATWTDNIAVSKVLFRSNHTGTWTNYTTADSICSQSGSEYFCTIPASELSLGESVGWNYWSNDTSGNWNTTMPIQVFTVVADATPPAISAVNATPGTVGLGEIVRIEANIADPGGISAVKVNITLPDSTVVLYAMTNNTPGIYEYSYTAWQSGAYYYSIWANDTYGNIQTYDPYFYAYGNATIYVYAEKDSYGSNENVNLKSMQNWTSQDQEPGTRQAKKNITLVNSTFESATEGFVYQDDLYGTSNAAEESGNNESNSYCASGSCLHVDLNTVPDITGPWSGGWNKSFNVTGSPDTVRITFFYTILATQPSEDTECTRLYYRNLTSYSYIQGDQICGQAPNGPSDYVKNGTITYNVTLSGGAYYFDAGCYLTTVSGSNEQGDCWIDNVTVTLINATPDMENTTDWITYDSIGGPEFSNPNTLRINTELSYYNASGSKNASNNYPGLEVAVWDGSSYSGNRYCNATGRYGDAGTGAWNCTILIANATIAAAWQSPSGRKLQVRGINFDTENSYNDAINWTGVYAALYNGSLLANTGATNISGYLLMTVQTNTSGSWSHVATVLDDTQAGTKRNITKGSVLDTGAIWNSGPWNTASYQIGWYRAYAALTDNAGNVLKSDSGTYINSTDEFEIVLFKFDNITDAPDPQGYGSNVTIQSDITGSAVHTALVEITYPDSTKSNFTMTNTTQTRWQYNFSGTWQWGSHSYRIHANDTANTWLSSGSSTFNISANATINIVTKNETYGPNEYVNLTRYIKNWWNTTWSYRIPITVSTGSYDRNDTIATAYFNFTQQLSALGITGTFDNNSIRLIEYSGDTVLHVLNSTFKNSTGYNSSINAVGEVRFILNGTNLKNTIRTFHIYFDTTSNGPKAAPSYDLSGINSKIYPSGQSVDSLNIYGPVGGHFVPANMTIELMDKGTFMISIYDKDIDAGTVGPSFHLYRPDGSYYGELGSNTNTYLGVWTNYTINASQSGSWHLLVNQTGESDDEFYMLRTYDVANFYFGNNLNREVDEYSPQFGGSSTHDHYIYVPEGTATFTVSNFDMDSAGSISYYYPNGTLYSSGTVSGNGAWQDDTITTGGIWGYWIARVTAAAGVAGYDVLARTSATTYLWLSPTKVPLWVPEYPPSIAKGSAEQLDTISKILNNGTTDTKTYILMRIQRWTGAAWENIGFPVVDQSSGTYTISSGSKLYLDALWESKGGWNTDSQPAGTYRVYAAMINSLGATLKDYFGTDLVATYNFTIISSQMELTSLTHENLYERSINEYETGDNISWINVTVTNRNATAINATIASNILDYSGARVTWGPDETKVCGDLQKDATCERRYDNSTVGYKIPIDATSGEYTFYWNITMSSEGGSTTQNSSLTFVVHHLPDNFTSLLSPEKIYQNKSSSYNFTINNSWSQNLTNVNVTISCPLNLGFTCNCTLSGQQAQNYCTLGNITGFGQNTAAFNISTNSTPAGDYRINATVVYINPGGELRLWSGQKNQILQVRIPGQMVNITSYPLKITRGFTGNLTGYSNNTLQGNMNSVWLNWTMPFGWSNSTGSKQVFYAVQTPGEILWANITAALNLGSALGPQDIELRASSEEGYEDWDTATITIYANTSFTSPASNNTNPSRSDTIRLSATLIYDNSTVIQSENITFNDTTSGVFLGWDLTDSSGYAYIDYQLSATESLGNHTINISYRGKDSPLYTNQYSNTTNITVHDRPLITSVTDTPDPQAYGYNVTIQANVTDWDGVSSVRVYIKPPGGSYTPYDMSNNTPDIYKYNYTDTWQNGIHDYYIWSQDSAGKSNESASYTFRISSNATASIKTANTSYGPTEYVNLTDDYWWNDTWNYRTLITINTSAYQRTNMLIERNINFTQYLSSLGTAGTFDNNSVRVIEWNQTSLANTVVNFTSEKASAPDPDLWDMSADAPQPVDYNSGLNYTANTFGAGAGDDGWDWDDDVYGDLPTGRPDGATETNVSASRFSSNGAARVRIGGIVSGTTEDAGDYETGAFGIQFYVSRNMYRVIENSGTANISFLYSMNATGTTAEQSIIYSRFNLNYLGSNQCGDSRSEIKCYASSTGNQDAAWQTASFNVTSYITGAGWYYLDFGAALQGWNAAGDGIDVFFDNITMKFYGSMYNVSENAVMNITWTMNGTTPANAIRNYYIYYDTIENSAKSNITYTVTGAKDTNPINITEQTPESRPSTLHNSGSTQLKGYLTMKVQRSVSGIWQDISGGVIVNNVSYNLSSGSSLYLDDIWNPVSWYTDKQPAGTYRAFAYLASPSGTILKNDDSTNISAAYAFQLRPPPSNMQIKEIRIYDVTDASDMKTDTSSLAGSGLNTTFSLYTEKYYRVEIIAWNNDTSTENWTIASSDTIYHENLNASWNITGSTNIWYTNSTKSFNQSANWSQGKVTWNTTQGGIIPVNQNATFYYILNTNATSSETISVHYLLNSTKFTQEDYSTYNIIFSESIPPKLNNNIYGINATTINRGSHLLAYAQWDEAINTAKAEYNSTTSSLVNTTIASPYTNRWTNRTIISNSSWILGSHSVKIYASDLNSNWNTTLQYLAFDVWGWSNISQNTLTPTTIIQGNSALMTCRVLSDNGSAISGYTVSFYNSTGLMGTNTTNSTGWAQFNFTDNSLGYETIKCNITDDAAMLYNDTSQNYREQTLRTIETQAPQYIQASQNVSIAHKGDHIKYQAFWTDNVDINYTWLETNETGSWKNNSLAGILDIESDSWSIFNIIVPMSVNPGNLAWRIYANDSSSNINVTLINITEIWGWAELTASTLNPGSIYVTNSTIFSCKVQDSNTSALSGYTVSFYNSTGLLGTNQTDSTGWAQWNYTDKSAGSETLVCNITDNATVRYNSSETLYQRTESLYTAAPGEDITPPYTKIYSMNSTVAWKGDHLLIYALWSEQIGNSYTEYNITSSALLRYTTGTISGNWTNHTIGTNSTWIPGRHMARLNASDQAIPANWNNSLSYQWFDVWGRSKVYWNSPAGNVKRSSAIPVSCIVLDKDSNQPIENYNVNFYDSSWAFIASDITNASGIAEVNWNAEAESPGSKTLRCTISNSSALYYNTTASDDDASTSITLFGTLNVTILAPANNSNFNIGAAISMNSTTKDDNSAQVTPDSASWRNTTSSIATGENTTWTIPVGHSLGPETISINVTKASHYSDEKNITIFVWGWSNTSWYSPDKGNYTKGTKINLTCQVQDANTSAGIWNYTVSFYLKNETNTYTLGSNLTNSTGHATYTLDTSPYSGGIYYPKCNITDNSTLYYNASYSTVNTTINITGVSGAFVVSLVVPPELTTTQVAQYRNLTVNATVRCINGACGTVNGTLQYSNITTPYTTIPLSAGSPFRINDGGQNPRTCGTMNQNDVCNLSWVINATGGIDTIYNISVLFDGTQSVDNRTQNATVEIKYILILTVTPDEIRTWYETPSNPATNYDISPATNSLPPGTSGAEASGAVTISLSSQSSDANGGIWVMGTNLTSVQSSGWYIPSTNMSRCSGNLTNYPTPNSASACLTNPSNEIQEYYTSFASSLSSGQSRQFLIFLDVPYGKPSYLGGYNGTVWVKVNGTAS